MGAWLYRFRGDPYKQGIDQFYGYNCQLLAHSYYPDHLWDNDKRVDLPDNNLNVQYGKGTYSQDLIHSKALAFLDEAAKEKDQPFFMWYPTIIPHAELIVPEDSIIKSFVGSTPRSLIVEWSLEVLLSVKEDIVLSSIRTLHLLQWSIGWMYM